MTTFSLLEQAEPSKCVLDIVRASIRYAFDHHGDRLPQHLIPRHPLLAENMACFVSLSNQDLLRGCVGTTVASDRLDENIAWYAYEAAFKDPRFDHIQQHEYQNLTTVVSVLSNPLPLNVTSEAELLQQLVPQHDGLIIQYGQLTGIFLPCMWQSFNSPESFLQALKDKTGWPDHAWTHAMKASVFQTYRYEGKLAQSK